MKEMRSAAERIGELLAREFKSDPNFYFFSPDETTSNRFGKIYEVEKRAWGLPTQPWDTPEGEDGRIVEMLSENVLFSVMTGHLMNGERAMMGGYEAFYSVVTSQILQHMKFMKQMRDVKWREPVPAVNLLSTSTCWRQDHNGYTHQSPALISTLLSVPSSTANCHFPVDDKAAEIAFNYMLNSTNVVNLTTFNKNPMPRYLNLEQAETQYNDGGAGIYEFISDENPDIVFTAAGDIATRESIEAIKILKKDVPGLKMRFVGIAALSFGAIGTTENKLSAAGFAKFFTNNKPIIANFHGYPEALEAILANYADRRRMRVHGFIEEGTTTTPFEMLRMNRASRYDLAMDVAAMLGRKDLVRRYQNVLDQNHANAVKNGEDLIK